MNRTPAGSWTTSGSSPPSWRGRSSRSCSSASASPSGSPPASASSPSSVCLVLSFGVAAQWIQRTNHPPEVAHAPRAEAEHGTTAGHRGTRRPKASRRVSTRSRDHRRPRPRTAAEESRTRPCRPVVEHAPRGSSGRARAMPPDAITAHGIDFEVGTLVDGLTAMMLVTVSIISLLVHIYSKEYLKGDVRFTHYYAFLSLFTAVDALLRDGRDHAADAGRLGAGRRLFVRPDRPLVGGEGQHRRRAQGVPHQPRRRRRPHPRRHHLVLRRRADASTCSTSTGTRSTAGANQTLLLVGALCSSAASPPSRVSSRCTPGCPTPWPAPRRCRRSSTPPPWSWPAST